MDEEMLFQKCLALVLGENGLYGKIQELEEQRV